MEETTSQHVKANDLDIIFDPRSNHDKNKSKNNFTRK